MKTIKKTRFLSLVTFLALSLCLEIGSITLCPPQWVMANSFSSDPNRDEYDILKKCTKKLESGALLQMERIRKNVIRKHFHLEKLGLSKVNSKSYWFHRAQADEVASACVTAKVHATRFYQEARDKRLELSKHPYLRDNQVNVHSEYRDIKHATIARKHQEIINYIASSVYGC